MDEEMRAMEREFENDFKFGQSHSILRAVYLPLAAMARTASLKAEANAESAFSPQPQVSPSPGRRGLPPAVAAAVAAPAPVEVAPPKKSTLLPSIDAAAFQAGTAVCHVWSSVR